MGHYHWPYSSGWWYIYPSEKYDLVHWDDDIPNIWENKKHAPNHQPVLSTIKHYYQWVSSLYHHYIITISPTLTG